jgi:4-amino-4-deoxy-L-arabinose transferase-like glycosyltransferase
MKEDKLHITVETLLYIVIVVIATGLRFSNLGVLPLTNSESEYALSTASLTGQASQFWNDGEATIPLSSTYHIFTAPVFYLVGASDVSARIIPALAGLVLVFSPLLLRKQLGSSMSLVLSFLFAISPALVTTSRTAGGASLASLGLIVGIALLFRVENGEHALSQIRWAGAAMGLALASGPFVFHGIFSLCIGALVLLVLSRGEAKRFLSVWGEYARQFLWIALGVMLVLAVGFGFSFTSIASLSEAIGSWVSGWGGPVEVPGLTTLAMSLIYEPLVLIFGLVGAIVSLMKKDRFGLATFSWMIGGLIAMLVYPARNGSDLTWVIIPLSVFAARIIVNLAGQIAQRKNWHEFLGLTCLLLVLLAFLYLQIAAYASGIGPAFDVMNRGLRLLLALGVLFLGGVVLAVFGVGWNWSIPGESLGLAGFLFLIVLNVSSLWRLNFAPTVTSPQELWRPEVSTHSMRLMVETLETMSQSYMRRPDTLGVSVQGEIPPSIAWAIRAFPKAGVKGGLGETAFPVVITSEEHELPPLSADYTGQGLNILERWGWEGDLPPDPITWWIKRNAPIFAENWVLLVRADIVSLGELGSSGLEAP